MGCSLLAVWLVFGQTIDYGFVNYDDEMNLYGNPAIARGLSAKGLCWAWTTAHGSQWAPITWMSYLADYQVYGLKPEGYHLTNVLLHQATTILLFLVLWRMTGRLWPCAFVAAVFAVHPLHVESVAWLSERKGLLSGLFCVLTLGAYIEYVRRRSLPQSVSCLSGNAGLFCDGTDVEADPGDAPLRASVVGLLAAGAMSTVADNLSPDKRACGSTRMLPHRLVWLLIAEKIPLLLLSIASCAIAPLAQGTAVIALEEIPLSARIGNALVSYVDYLGETFWPASLAVFYPHPMNTLPTWKPVVAILILLGVTAAVLVRRRRNPYLPVGWLWYVGMLVPAIGLVQIGSHAMADRYMYLPQIGLCLALTWGALDVARSWSRPAWECGAIASVLVVALAACAFVQTTYWRDSESLWTHAIACTPSNSLAHTNLGGALADRGRFDRAIEQYQTALAIDRNDAKSYSLLGDALMRLNRTDEAIEQYENAVRIQPDSAETQSHYAAALMRKGRLQEAVEHGEKALRIERDNIDAHCNLGNALARLGRFDDAIAQYQEALKIAPNRGEIRHNLDVVESIRAKQKTK